MDRFSKTSHLTILEKEQDKAFPRSIQEINERSMRAFREQAWYGENFLAEFLGIDNYSGKRILEVGPAEAGLLHFFHSIGATCAGIELSPLRYANAQLLNKYSDIKLEKGDICNPSSYSHTFPIQFDIIVIRDVIEHIDDKLTALKNMLELLAPDGRLFISFPPRYCPYAGHQQTVKNPLCKIPYIHLLPNDIYSAYLRLMGHPFTGIDYLIATKKTRVSINEMEHLFYKSGFEQERRGLFFFRPAYKFRFGLPKMRNNLGWIPLFRELFTNGALYVLKRRNIE